MRQRLFKIRKLLSEQKLDALLVTNRYNCRYLSSFTGSAGLLLISLEKALLVTDFRYLEQAAEQADDFEIVERANNLPETLAQLIADNSWKRVGFEAKDITYAFYCELQDKLSAELVSLEESAEKQRMIKDKQERLLLRKGAKLLDSAFEYCCSLVKPGMTEIELARELEIFLLQNGAESKAFYFIVASGERGALPHGVASAKKMARGDLVTIDFGAVFEGYATDMTRTIGLGNVSQRGREIYGIVKEAQEKAAAVISAGLKGFEADAAAREVFKKAGLDQYFGHGLGHGLGLETHEAPVINKLSKTVLEPGMVITVEPGLYIPGWGGVRIEDMVAVTEEGADLLTGSCKSLIII